MRRTLSVRLSGCPSVPLSLPSVTSRHLANYNDTHVLFGTRWGPHIVRPSRLHRFLLSLTIPREPLIIRDSHYWKTHIQTHTQTLSNRVTLSDLWHSEPKITVTSACLKIMCTEFGNFSCYTHLPFHGHHFYSLLTVVFQQHCAVHKARRWDWDKETTHNITSWSHLTFDTHS